MSLVTTWKCYLLIRAMMMVHALVYGCILSCSVVATAVKVEKHYNDQIMLRVLDRLDDLMSIPIEACDRLERYYKMNGFQYGMTAQDRKSIFHFLSMEVERFPLYFALEDGAFFMMIDETTISYREPGNSGYIINNNIFNNDPNYKHFISCVNSTDGEQTNCTFRY